MSGILFSGVHGVGKGFFLNKVRVDIGQYNVYSASKLIENYQAAADAGYKQVSSVKNNQDVLINAIKNISERDTKNFILDGHLCIFNAEGDVERIPEYFFEETHITGVVLLQDSPETICKRINQRDASDISLYAIQKMQDEEQKYAEELRAKLQIKCVYITHDCTRLQFEEILRDLGGSMNE